MPKTIPHIQKVPQTYINLSVDELDANKLTTHKLGFNNTLNDAMADSGDAVQVRKVFLGFHRYLYS